MFVARHWQRGLPTNPLQGTTQPPQPRWCLGETDQRKGKNAWQRRREQKGVRNSPADSQVREEGGAPGAGADSPAVCGAAHGEAAVPLQHMEDTTPCNRTWPEASCYHGEPMQEPGFLQPVGRTLPWGPTLEQRKNITRREEAKSSCYKLIITNQTLIPLCCLGRQKSWEWRNDIKHGQKRDGWQEVGQVLSLFLIIHSKSSLLWLWQ